MCLNEELRLIKQGVALDLAGTHWKNDGTWAPDINFEEMTTMIAWQKMKSTLQQYSYEKERITQRKVDWSAFLSISIWQKVYL